MNPQHPNEPLLEAILTNQDSNAKNHSELMEHMIVQNEKNNPAELLEAQLIKADEIVQTLKNKPEVQKIKIVTDESELADNFFRMLRGQKGEVGDKGDSIKGDKGDKGEDSTVEGPKGEQGIKGLDGDRGLDGKDGKDGKNGKDGLDGRDGKDGEKGEPGEKGQDGKSLTQTDIDRIGKKLKDNESNLLWVNNGAVKSITAGTGVTITGDPQTPTINASAGSGTVTSVAALTLGTTGTDLSSTVATGTTTPVITLQVPTASATNRGALSSTDWSTFNNKQPAGTYATGTGTANGTNTGDNSANSSSQPVNTNLTSIGGLANAAGALTNNGAGVFSYAAAGTGDMVLASIQTVTGAKTFNNAKLYLRNIADTFSGVFSNAVTAARTWTFPDKDGTVAMTSDITGTNSGTNTGDQTITLTGGVTGSGTGSFASTVVTNANLTGVVTSTGNATAIADAALSIAKTSGLQSALDLKAPLANPTFTGAVTVPTPTNATDASTKAYVDATAQGLAVKESVRVATTAALPTNTYSNGASGVGATLTAVALGALTVDGVAMVLNDRILVKDEVATANNGIYYVSVAGTAGVAYVLTRSLNMDTTGEFSGAFCFTEEGTVNSEAGFVCTSNDPITVGTTAITFTQFSGAGQITAGTGLTKTGNTLDVVGTTNRITANADSIDISTSYVGQSSITTLGTVGTGVWNAGIVTTPSVNINGTAGAGYLTLVGQASNPTSPAAGTLLLHSSTANGFTRMEQDNEATTNLVYGRDVVFIAKNTTAGTLSKGQVVYISGSTGNVPNVALAQANSNTTLPTVGIVVDNILAGAFGQVMTTGIISNFDTSAFASGAPVWVSATVAGGLTATRPSGTTNAVQRIGSVLVSGVGNGSLLIKAAPAVLNMETGTNAATWTGSAIVGSSLALGAGSITMSGSVGVTGTRITKLWATDIESTNAPTVGGVIVDTISATNALTNKTLTSTTNTFAEVTTTTSSATPTPTGGSRQNELYLTAQALNMTFAAPTGTAVNGNSLIIRMTPDATPRTIAYNAIYRAVGVTLPTTTVASKDMYFGCKYNSTAVKWDIIAYGILA